MDSVEPFVINGEGVLTPPDRDRWVTAAMVRAAEDGPSYAVGEVSKIFFAHSPHWLRNRLTELAETFVTGRTDGGHRRFDLHDIEELAHRLLVDGKISAFQFAMTIRMVKAAALMHHYEIGDTGFLLRYWNGAIAERRRAITDVMEALQHFDAGRAFTGLAGQTWEQDVLQAALAIRQAERKLIEGRTT